MNVYDFDGTIYDGDSTIDFYIYCLKNDIKIIRFLPYQCMGTLMHFISRKDKTKYKEMFYIFLKSLGNPEKLVADFWINHMCKIKEWYLYQQKEDDVIISASPEFLLWPVCEKINVKYLLASEVSINTGKYKGRNCRGKEKVNRFKASFPACEINKFYSDSKSDLPLAMLADESYICKGNNIVKWEM